MSGPYFLYTHYAIGLDAGLVKKIRTLVTGKRRMLDGVPIEWRSIRDVRDDLDKHVRARLKFTKNELVTFKELFDTLSEYENQMLQEIGTIKQENPPPPEKRKRLSLKKI
jgi:hypothetical protein